MNHDVGVKVLPLPPTLEEEGTMIENFMGPQNLAEEWLLCETNLKSF